jgi:uncharacterized protein (TIGR03435 family)
MNVRVLTIGLVFATFLGFQKQPAHGILADDALPRIIAHAPLANRQIPSKPAAQAHAPARARQPLAFAAVSIAPAGTPLDRPPSNPTYQQRQGTLRQIIEIAYGVTRARTSGGPPWMDSLSWQVAAKAAESSAPYTDVREMLRTLLADRFRLSAAFVTMPVSSVLLSFEHAKREGVRPAHVRIDCQPFLNGLKPPTAVPHTSEGWPMCGPAMQQHSFTRPVIHYRSAPLDRVALDLEKELGQVVLLVPPRPGLFDVDFTWPPGYNASTPDRDVDAFLSALHDQLGVEALIKTTPVEVLQIESAAQPVPGVH